MALDFVGVVTGGMIGLVGGIGGVLLGHHLSQKRESVSRKIEGLRQVVEEINRFSRIALFFEQQINLASATQDPDEIAKHLISLPEWQKATHELQEAHWRFPAMAYLPASIESFRELNRLIGYFMDPSPRATASNLGMSREQALERFTRVAQHIQSLVEVQLKQLT